MQCETCEQHSDLRIVRNKDTNEILIICAECDTVIKYNITVTGYSLIEEEVKIQNGENPWDKLEETSCIYFNDVLPEKKQIVRGGINNYSVEISLDSDYEIKATDNKSEYCKIINFTRNEKYRAISIKIQNVEDIKEVCLIVPMFYTGIDKSVVLTEKYIFFMFDRLLFLFDPITMGIVKQTEIPSSGTMIAAYSYNEDFILHGEMEVYRVTKDLEIKWEFLGKDIFVKCKGEEPAFKMKDDRICLYDFEDNYYEINYEGENLLERK